MITWPEEADQSKRNPIFIEKFFQQLVKDSQVTLLGEIDFDVVQNYANAHMTLRQLAQFAFGKQLIQNSLANWTSGSSNYPGIVSVWVVAQAQNLEDGTELWPTSGLSGRALAHLPRAFSESISALELETFAEQLDGTLRHITLARLHAVIPSYALDKYISHIKRGATYHRSPRLIHADILKAQDMSRAIQKLFEEKSELGLDLIDRSIQTVRHGKDAGLPPRLTLALTQGISQSTFQMGTHNLELPVIALDENAGELYLRGKSNWDIFDEKDKEVNTDRLPKEKIYAVSIDQEYFTLLDTSDDYLLFNLELELVDHRSLPSRGGIILFSNAVSVDNSIFTTEAVEFYSWAGWKMAYFQADARLQVVLKSGVIRNLVPRQSLEIKENYAPYLFTRKGYPILHQSPLLLRGQVATAINHITHERTSLGPDETPISSIDQGPLDVTIYAGLGKSRNIKGLLVPGISITGDFSPLIKGEMRELGVAIPIGWTGNETVQVTYEDLESRTFFAISDPNSKSMQIYIDLPKLHWSIEFVGESPEILNVDTVYPTVRVKNLFRLVLHGLGENNPRLIFRQGNAQTVITGSPRNQDCLYELLVVQDASVKNDAKLLINISGREISLATFRVKPATPPKRKMVSVTDLSQLATTAVQQGVISDEDWDNFETERRASSAQLRKSLREKREQWK